MREVIIHWVEKLKFCEITCLFVLRLALSSTVSVLVNTCVHTSMGSTEILTYFFPDITLKYTNE